MADARELVDVRQVGIALAVLSGAALLLAAVLFAAARSRKQESFVRWGLACAAAIPVFPLWLAYNRIEDWLGLDSSAALLLNLALFAAAGIAGGLALRRFLPSAPAGIGESESSEQ